MLVYFDIPSLLRFPVSPLFPSGMGEFIFVISYFIWFYFDIINQVFATFRNRNAKVSIKNDKFSIVAIYIGYIAILYTVGWLGGLRVSTGFGGMPVWTFYLGLAVLFLGIFMRLWSEYTLGRFFTYPVMVLKGHRLVRRGPYRYIRHPSYLGGLLIVMAFGFVVRSWIGVVAAAGIILLAYSYRIYLEESALRRNFGKEYENYARKTKMLIPNIL
ncbi:MAG: isoprenylcysteine carboxylmethyltransferase family protein [Candidatus Micrarchaeota archaeon]|nr:isoprenylcysteine carboxylmethyltransferase family protein [Candidatus Micrarchaeota archaeon]